MDNLFGWKTACAIFLFWVATAITLPAQTFTTLVNFNDANGKRPFYMSPVQGADGNFYGTTYEGGKGAGTVFKITSAGTLTTLYIFCSQANCSDGELPTAGLVLATDGNFYGTTINGGANKYGTVFKITSAGTLTTLYSFCTLDNCVDGAYPIAGLVQATDGNFYGTTLGSSGQSCSLNCGTVYKITPAGALTTLYSFCTQTNCPDGGTPYAGLIQATDGNFYGTTFVGGTNNAGTVFRITSGGTLTTLYSFCARGRSCSDGAGPIAGLGQAKNGDFYGTTSFGGGYNSGTVFKLTPQGTLTTLHQFCRQFPCTDGNLPEAGLVQATDGNFYGTTANGGTRGDGTIFKIASGGILTTLHSFDGTDGYNPFGGLLQATDGNFYGTTISGVGNAYDGTVFSLSVGLGPFVKTLPTTGKVGRKVIILGTTLTGTTSVAFNGTAATFTVVSSTEITTTVPVGATSGKVQVTTPGGTLSSNVPFRVRP